MIANFDLYSQKIDSSSFKTKIARVEIAGRDVEVQDIYYIKYQDNALELGLETIPHIPNVTYK